MLSRAEAKSLIEDPFASEDDLALLVYGFPEYHIKLARKRSVSPAFLSWMRSVTTDDSVREIIDARLDEAHKQSLSASQTGHWHHSPAPLSSSNPQIASGKKKSKARYFILFVVVLVLALAIKGHILDGHDLMRHFALQHAPMDLG